jgi:hypothetical protein
MFFRVKSTSPKADLAIYRTKKQARLALTLYQMGPTELLLSRFLQENYNLTLKAACLKILQNARYHLNIEQDLIITIPDTELNNIAKLITYGNGKLAGSKILREMWRIS